MHANLDDAPVILLTRLLLIEPDTGADPTAPVMNEIMYYKCRNDAQMRFKDFDIRPNFNSKIYIDTRDITSTLIKNSHQLPN